jgi:hypothetical protein
VGVKVDARVTVGVNVLDGVVVAITVEVEVAPGLDVEVGDAG